MEQSFSYLSHILSILVLSCDILGVFCMILHDFAIRCRIWQLVGLDGVLGSSWPSESHGGILWCQILQVSMVREVSDTCRCSGTSASCQKLSAVSGLSTFLASWGCGLQVCSVQSRPQRRLNVLCNTMLRSCLAARQVETSRNPNTILKYSEC